MKESDLYNYVHRCYLKSPYDYSKKARDIRILSNDSLLQGIHSMNVSMPSQTLDFENYLDLYRNPDRHVIYFERTHGITSLTVKREKLDNHTIKDLIMKNGIEIVY